MQRRTWSSLVVGLCVAAVTGCSDTEGTGGTGGIAFTVLQTDPPNLATQVSPNTAVTAVFAQPVDARSVTTESVVIRQSEATNVPGALIVQDETVTFTPDLPLGLLATYEGTITPAVQSNDGTRLEAEVSWTFTVRDGRWGTADAIETVDGGGARYPEVALDGSGNGVVVWEQWDGERDSIWANQFVDGAWSTPEQIQDQDAHRASLPQVAVDATGNGVAVWRQSGAVWANRLFDGEWGTAHRIETPFTGRGVFAPQVTLDPSGDGVAVWAQFDGSRYSIWANRFVDGAWDTAQPIENNDVGNSRDPQVALGPLGNAIAVWSTLNGRRTSTWANRLVDGEWGTAERIDANDSDVESFPEVALDPWGNGVAVWRQSDGTQVSIWTNRLVDGEWGMAERIDSGDSGDAGFPQLALDPRGNGVAVWHRSDGTRFDVWANRFVDGGWDTAERIDSNDTGDSGLPEVALDPLGNGVAVWAESNEPSGTVGSIVANRFVDGAWGTAELIENNGAAGGANPQVALDPFGRGLAAWWQWLDMASEIGVTRFD